MKKVLFVLIIISVSLSRMTCFNAPVESQNFYYTYNIDHLFTHCLLAYPEIAFSPDNNMSKFYAQDCITHNEFLNILNSLHKNNYALISINECYSINSFGIAIKNKVKVPIGKKPIIFSFDDVNYDSKKQHKGMVDKIILDSNGKIASQTLINGKLDTRYGLEFIPILENFIIQHPDFSIRGAKGLINLTGYDGILGYRTNSKNHINRPLETREAKKVVRYLKNNGWEFASHGYGHYHMSKISDTKFEEDLALWEDEVQPIVGKTNIYVYPYGDWVIFEDGIKSEKHKLLEEYGFCLFCGVGMKTFYSYIPNTNNIKVLFMDRKNIDGMRIQSNNKELEPFFNCSSIIDKKYRNY